MSADETNMARHMVDRFMSEHALPTGPEHACPYLPGRTACSEGFETSDLDDALYLAFMDRGFRRSGNVIYRPSCRTCAECIPIRIPVPQFRLSRSMKRVWRRNRDLHVEVGPPVPDKEKYQVYVRYLDHQHDGTMTGSRDEFLDFLYNSPVQTLEFTFRLGRRLVGASLADRCRNVLSAVYMYFDPEHRRRGLGTYSILWEIAYAARQNLDYYYLGYFVADCPKMSYKAHYRPFELLHPNGRWEPGPDRTE
jgi:arginine-tRNA-protein transferase